jgi:hypothetical protein
MVRWEQDGNVVGEEEIIVREFAEPAPGEGFMPSVGDVADIMFARTRSRGGGITGEFTDNTTPTAERVERFIGRAYRHVMSKVGTLPEELDEDLENDLRNVISYYTGMLIELGSESINKDRYDYLKELFDSGIGMLIEAFGGMGETVENEQTGSINRPVFSFPEPGIGVRTVW